MASRLLRSVVAGGVVYPAGTAATPELRELIDARHWSGDEAVDVAAYEQAIAELEQQISQLAAENAELRAQLAELGTDEEPPTEPPAPPVDPSTVPAYGDQTVEVLQGWADSRGLEVEGTGKGGNVLKADLVAALEADDQSPKASGD